MYRDARFIERCDICLEPARAACRRCGRPFCRRHAPPAEALCDSCESEFIRRTTRVARALLDEWTRAFLRTWSRFVIKSFAIVVAVVGALFALGWVVTYLRAPADADFGLAILGLVLFAAPLVAIGAGCAGVVLGARLLYRYRRWRFIQRQHRG